MPAPQGPAAVNHLTLQPQQEFHFSGLQEPFIQIGKEAGKMPLGVLEEAILTSAQE